MRIAILHIKSMAATGISLLMLATSAAATSPAGEPGTARTETTEMRVSLGDLDLTTRVGVDVAILRLKAAAQRLCRRLTDDRKVSSWETYSDCSRESFAMTVRHLRLGERLANVESKESPRIATNE